MINPYLLYLSGVISENQYQEIQEDIVETSYDTIESLPPRKPYPRGLANHQYPMPFQKRPESHDEWQCPDCETWNEESQIRCSNCGKHHDNARVETRNSKHNKASSLVEAASKHVMEAVKKLEAIKEILKDQKTQSGYPVDTKMLEDSWVKLTVELKRFSYLHLPSIDSW